MSQGNRFDQLLKAAQQQPQAETPAAPALLPDVQTSEHSGAQTSKQPDISTSKAKSSSPDYKRTTMYLSQALHRRLKRASLDHGVEMSDIAEAAIAQWIDQHPSDQA